MPRQLAARLQPHTLRLGMDPDHQSQEGRRHIVRRPSRRRQQRRQKLQRPGDLHQLRAAAPVDDLVDARGRGRQEAAQSRLGAVGHDNGLDLSRQQPRKLGMPPVHGLRRVLAASHRHGPPAGVQALRRHLGDHAVHAPLAPHQRPERRRAVQLMALHHEPGRRSLHHLPNPLPAICIGIRLCHSLHDSTAEDAEGAEGNPSQEGTTFRVEGRRLGLFPPRGIATVLEVKRKARSVSQFTPG